MQAQAQFQANDCPHHPQCTAGHGPCWEAFAAICGMGVGMMANVAVGNDPFNMNSMNMGLNMDMKVSSPSHHHKDGATVSVNMPGMQVSMPGIQAGINIGMPSVSVALPGVNVSLPTVHVAMNPLPFPVQPYSGSKSFVEIVLDKPYYLAGETVTGRADLSVHQHISSASCLMIKWKGFERTMIEKWVDQKNPNGGASTRELVKVKENKDFFSQALTLFNFGGAGIGCGKYTFPFTYKLPATLPGVFYDEQKEVDGVKLRCAIVYKVKCWLDMKGKDIKKDYKIVISEPVTKSIVPVSAEKSKSFLLARGDLKLRAELPKNVYVPGETIPVRVLVDNESSKKVDALKIKLMRTIKIKAQHEKRENCYEVHRMKYDGVDPKSKKDIVLNFVLDNKIYPSTDGSLVDCKYHLDVECDVAMAIDLEVHPKITVALLPAANQSIDLYANYGARAW